MQKSLLFTLLLLGALQGSLRAQNLFSCADQTAPGALSCASSCVYCNLDGLIDINDKPLPPNSPTTSCDGSMPLETPKWYGFIAGSPTITFNVNYISCQGTNGLQLVVTRNCGMAMACNLTGAGPSANVASITVANLIVGQPYQLLVDGIDGEICSYEIEVASGFASPFPLGPLGSIQGLTNVCPNATVTYSIPPVDNAVTYTWTAPTGASINGGGNSLTIEGPLVGSTVSIKFGANGGNICVSATNVCSPPVQTCLPVTVSPIPVTVLPDLIVCKEDAPFEWAEEPNTYVAGTGTFLLTSTPYTSYLGCDSIVQQTVTVLPQKVSNLGTLYLCEGECYVVGDDYEICDPGFHQETIQAENGCDSTIRFTIVFIPNNAVVQQADTITCAQPSVQLSGMGSTTGGAVFYQWLNPSGIQISNTVNATATAPGEYTFIVRNGAGGSTCYDTTTVVVPSETTVPQADAGPNLTLTCSVTQLQIQGSGSAGSQYSYFWKATNGGNIVSGSTTLTPTINMPGFYTLRVTNNLNGCTSVSVTVVTAQTDSPELSLAGGTLTCNSPAVTLQTATNAVNPVYTWTGPDDFTSSQASPVVDVAGTYTVVVTDGPTGCTNSATAVVIGNNEEPGATAGGGTLTCTVTSLALDGNSATPGVQYAWTGPNNFTSSLPDPVVTVDGTYQLTVTGANGCTSTDNAIVALDRAAPGANLSVSGNLNCNNAAVNLVVSSTANPALLGHVWTLPDASTENTGADAFLAATAAGEYSVLVTNSANGCTSSATASVIQYPAVAVTTEILGAACFGSSTGGAVATATGGNGTYTYLWSNDGATPGISGLAAGTYVVTVSDADGCSATATAVVTQPDQLLPNATATAQTSNGATDGTATVNPSGGSPAYAILWSNDSTGNTITGLAPGSYTVSVTDANNCVAVQTVTVNAYNCVIDVAVVAENVSCFGNNDGAASLEITGGTAPFTYNWSTEEQTDAVDSLEPGLYSVSVVDAANCPVNLSFAITEPSVLSANVTSTSTSGLNFSDGSATANPTGGTAPYTYLWNTNDTTATIINLDPGEYVVSVTDANGCQAVQSVVVEVGNCGLSTDLLVLNPLCHGQATGAATILLTGGSAPFTYQWSSGSDTATETGLAAGDYTVEVTDAEGCAISVPVTITQPEAITIVEVMTTTTPCPAAPEGTATVIATGGTDSLSIVWPDEQTSFTAVGLAAGSYIATITDGNGCTATATASVGSLDSEAPEIAGGTATVPLGSSGAVTLTPQVLALNITDNCAIGSIVIAPNTFNCDDLGPHTITIDVLDEAGNASSDTLEIVIVDNAQPVLTCPPSVVRCFGDGVVQYNAPTASDNCLGFGGAFDFVSGLPSGSTFPVGTTPNVFTYTDAQGNVGSCTFEVTVLTQLSIFVQNVKDDNGNPNNGAIDLSVTGSLSPYSYEWFLNGAPMADTTQDISGLGAGVYTVIVTDANGCTIGSQNIPVASLVGTDTPEWAGSLSLQPNPSAGSVTLVLPESVLDSEARIVVFDATGRRVAEQHSRRQARIGLDLNAAPSGLYSVLIQIDGRTVAKKLVISR